MKANQNDNTKDVLLKGYRLSDEELLRKITGGGKVDIGNTAWTVGGVSPFLTKLYCVDAPLLVARRELKCIPETLVYLARLREEPEGEE
ncbi:MAG: hypothetical protein Q8M92_05205 [Candidatus Subteraquimicrobiales bacterium]|nr:hypothetical protein [Candidatus Subteraquimicrobiales bacterium]